MGRGFFDVPTAVNEPVKGYAPGSKEREELLAMYKSMYSSNIDVPMHINGEEIRTENTRNITKKRRRFPPTRFNTTLYNALHRKQTLFLVWPNTHSFELNTVFHVQRKQKKVFNFTDQNIT